MGWDRSGNLRSVRSLYITDKRKELRLLKAAEYHNCCKLWIKELHKRLFWEHPSFVKNDRVVPREMGFFLGLLVAHIKYKNESSALFINLLYTNCYVTCTLHKKHYVVNKLYNFIRVEPCRSRMFYFTNDHNIRRPH